MTAILSGSSRTVLGYIRTHWLELIQVSMAPFIAIIVILAAEFWMFGEFFSAILAMVEKGQGSDPFNPDVWKFYPDLMRYHASSLLLQLAVGVVSTWQFVRITRLYLRNEVAWVGLNQPVIIATLMTMLYGIGIAMLSFLVLIAGVLVGAIPFALVVAGSNADAGSILVIVGLVIALIVLFLWFVCRFAVGLPAVAMGETPDFFKDLWGISKGESWGYPLRLLGAMAIMMVVLLPISLIYAFFVLGKMWMDLTADADLKTVSPELLRDLLDNILWGQILWGAIMQPAAWFFALLTVECYRRFKAKRSGDVVAAAPGPIAI
jgi:hypothetical protein